MRLTLLVANQLFATSKFLKYVYDIEKVLLWMDIKIFDVSELFRCYFDLFPIFFRCFFSMFSLSMFCLFHVFAFLCFVVLCFVIDPFREAPLSG